MSILSNVTYMLTEKPSNFFFICCNRKTALTIPQENIQYKRARKYR